MSKQAAKKISKVSHVRQVVYILLACFASLVVLTLLVGFIAIKVLDHAVRHISADISRQNTEQNRENELRKERAINSEYSKITIPEEMKLQSKSYDPGESLYPNTATIDYTYTFSGNAADVMDGLVAKLHDSNIEVHMTEDGTELITLNAPPSNLDISARLKNDQIIVSASLT